MCTVKVLLEINALVRECNRTAATGMVIPVLKTWCVACWADGAWAVRANGDSQGGYLLGLVDDSFMAGDRGTVCPISWSSWKLGRVARSSCSAEVQALVDSQGELDLCRLLITELLRGAVNYEHRTEVDQAMRSVPAVLATDARSGFDALARNESAGLGLKESRTAIECRGLRQSQKRTEFELTWVHSDAMLGDGLTKQRAAAKLHQFFVDGQVWRLVHDPMFKSARRRKRVGMGALDNEDEDETIRLPQQPETVGKENGSVG